MHNVNYFIAHFPLATVITIDQSVPTIAIIVYLLALLMCTDCNY